MMHTDIPDEEFVTGRVLVIVERRLAREGGYNVSFWEIVRVTRKRAYLKYLEGDKPCYITGERMNTPWVDKSDAKVVAEDLNQAKRASEVLVATREKIARIHKARDAEVIEAKKQGVAALESIGAHHDRNP